ESARRLPARPPAAGRSGPTKAAPRDRARGRALLRGGSGRVLPRAPLASELEQRRGGARRRGARRRDRRPGIDGLPPDGDGAHGRGSAGRSHEPRGGAARRGGAPPGGVAGPSGEVFGGGGLYVADASLFPTSCRADPQLTVM